MGKGLHNLGDKSLWMATEEQEEGFRGDWVCNDRKLVLKRYEFGTNFLRPCRHLPFCHALIACESSSWDIGEGLASYRKN